MTAVLRCPSCGCIGRRWSKHHAPHCEGRVIDGLARIEHRLDVLLGLVLDDRTDDERGRRDDD